MKLLTRHSDQDPVPEQLRTWTGWDYTTYWMSDLINATTWQIASAAMLVGLSTTDAILIASLAAILNSLPTGMSPLYHGVVNLRLMT